MPKHLPALVCATMINFAGPAFAQGRQCQMEATQRID